MRLAAVWMLALTALTTPVSGYEWPALRPQPASRPPFQHAIQPDALPKTLLDSAVSGKFRSPALLLVQDVDHQGRVRILREARLNNEGGYVNAGRFREVDLSQRLLREGRFKDGRRDGHWVQIHRQPLPPLFREAPYASFEAPFYSEADFQDGRLHGAWRIYDAQRRLVSEIQFARGVRHGLAKWLHVNGVTMRESLFQNGAPHGANKRFDAMGEVVAREDFDAGRRLFAETEFYPDQDSPQSAGFFLDGHLRAVTPDNWERCEFARFQPIGKPAKHGVFTKWHSSGEKAMQGEYVDNQPRGVFTWWYESGETRSIGSFADGHADGPWRWWRENGVLQMDGEYRDGKPFGEWRFYDEDGKLQQSRPPRLLALPEAVQLVDEAAVE